MSVCPIDACPIRQSILSEASHITENPDRAAGPVHPLRLVFAAGVVTLVAGLASVLAASPAWHHAGSAAQIATNSAFSAGLNSRIP
ncbi:hypothetical protein SBBP2_870014 [Burkholderiales bacterium]|nr:hypothetical protein SBBP2_870014 [Burkholderiales bacterium]